MCKMFSYWLIIGLIYTREAVANPNTEYNVCSKLMKNSSKFNCVLTTECTSLNKLIRDGKVVHCGEDNASDAKVCCPRSSRRVVRQATPAKKDPYFIARQKCNEYSSARYVVKITPADIPHRPPIETRKLDCVKAQPLIFGGVAAQLKEFPHMALIGYTDRPDRSVNDTQWACGGSLISDRYVLTAAHCIRSGSYEANWVRLGELVVNNDNDSSQPKDFRIIQRIPHPQYTGSSVYFDIMLLKLKEPVKFTPHMRPICLYTSSILAAALHNKALITGWGVTATGEQSSEPLLKAQISFANDSECTATYKGDKKLAKGYDKATMICAGDKFHGRDTCAGDSGGPLQVPIPEWTCMYSQVGITSYGGFICGQKNVSAIYTKIAPYIPWIQSIVWP